MYIDLFEEVIIKKNNLNYKLILKSIVTFYKIENFIMFLEVEINK